jgi:group I intron endonuclease
MVKDPVGTIYLIRNKLTGKKYVGQTRYSLSKRWRNHCHSSSGCRVLKRAIAKYGVRSFEMSVLESQVPQEKLDERERHWIGKLRTKVPVGYNLLEGGNSTALVNTRRSKTRKAQLAALAEQGLPKGPSSLTESDVREIFERSNSGESQKDIAKHFKVHTSTVSHITEGKNWSHLGLTPTRNRRRKISKNQAIETLRLKSLGASSVRIGTTVGISKGSVNRVVRGALFPELQP